MTISVQQAGPLDRRVIYRLVEDTFDNSKAILETVKKHERVQGHMTLVATLDGQFAGFMCYIRQEFSFIISLIAVDEVVARRGVGSALIAKLVKRLNPGTTIVKGPSDANLRRIVTSVGESNKKALNCFIKNGFVATTDIPKPFGKFDETFYYMVYDKRKHR